MFSKEVLKQLKDNDPNLQSLCLDTNGESKCDFTDKELETLLGKCLLMDTPKMHIRQDILSNAKDKNKPLLVRDGYKFLVYGDKNNDEAWIFTEIEQNLEGFFFNFYGTKTAKTEVVLTPFLFNALKQGHTFTSKLKFKELLLRCDSKSIDNFVFLLEINPNLMCFSIEELYKHYEDKPEYWTKMFEALMKNSRIKSLSINGRIPLVELGKYLNRLNTLIELKLTATKAYNEEEIELFFKSLKTNKSLETLVLDLSITGREPYFGILSSTLYHALIKNTTLKILDLSRTRETRENSKLGYYDYGRTTKYSSLSATEIRRIANLLKLNTALQKLSLDYHYDIGNEGAKAIGIALSKNNTLKELSIKRCDIDDVGAKYIADGLRGNRSLEKLDLSENKIGEKGAQAFCDMLVENRTIKYIIFYQNKIEKGIFSRPSNINFETLIYIEKDLYSNRKNSAVKLALDAYRLKPLAENKVVEIKSQVSDDRLDHSIIPRLKELEQKMTNLDEHALQVLQGKSEEMALVVQKAAELRHVEIERRLIEADDILCEFYYVIRCQLLNTWLACKTIHSSMVENGSKTKFDYIAEHIDELGKRFPGLSILTLIIKKVAQSWSYRTKQAAVNNMATLFIGLVEGDHLIDTLARQLTIAQTDQIKLKLIPSKNNSRIKEIAAKAYAGFKEVKNWVLVNDINNPTKEFAAEQASKIIAAVMEGKIKCPCRNNEELSQLFVIVTGQKYIYQATNILSSVSNFGKESKNSITMKGDNLKIKSDIFTRPNKQEIQPGDVKKLVEKIHSQEKMINEMLTTFNQIQQNHNKKTNNVDIIEFSILKSEVKTMQSQSRLQVMQQEIIMLRKKLTELESTVNDNTPSSGNGLLQMTRSANSGGFFTEQVRMIEIEKQISLITDELRILKENQTVQLPIGNHKFKFRS